MFGKLKESVLANLESTMKDKGEKDFKDKFAKYIRVLKENETLRSYNETYNLLNESKFDDEFTAKIFLDESISRLKELDTNSTEKLKELTEEIVSIEGTLNHSIDELVFKKDLGIVETVEHRVKLVNNLVKGGVDAHNLNEKIESISNNLSDKISKLNEEQVKVLSLFSENEEHDIKDYYDTLISETNTLVNQAITESEDIVVIKKLLSVNTKLNEMSKEKPTLESVSDILDLKKTFI